MFSDVHQLHPVVESGTLTPNALPIHPPENLEVAEESDVSDDSDNLELPPHELTFFMGRAGPMPTAPTSHEDVAVDVEDVDDDDDSDDLTLPPAELKLSRR